MNPYKCEKHKLNYACLGCIRAWIARHDKMLEFVKKIAKADVNYLEDESYDYLDEIALEAKEILKEIGR